MREVSKLETRKLAKKVSSASKSKVLRVLGEPVIQQQPIVVALAMIIPSARTSESAPLCLAWHENGFEN